MAPEKVVRFSFKPFTLFSFWRTTLIRQARWLIGSLRIFSVTYGCLLKFQRSVKRHFKREDELASNVYSANTSIMSVLRKIVLNMLKKSRPCSRVFFSCQIGAIEIKRNVRLFFLHSLIFLFLLPSQLFFLLWSDFKAYRSSEVNGWFGAKFWLYRVFIHPLIHITSGMIRLMAMWIYFVFSNLSWYREIFTLTSRIKAMFTLLSCEQLLTGMI